MQFAIWLPTPMRIACYRTTQNGRALAAIFAPQRPPVTTPHTALELALLDETAARKKSADRSPRARFRELRVAEITRQTVDAITIWFENPSSDPLTFKPGQYITLVLSIGERKYRRSYSLSSSPAQRDRVAVTIKRVADGVVSNWLIDHVRVGDRLRTLGPSGGFVWEPRKDGPQRIVLLGAGAGITPLFSILQAALASPSATTVCLLYGSRSEADVIFASELEALSQAHRERLTVQQVLSRPTNGWNGPTGRLDVTRLPDLLEVDPHADYFICGPQGMMDAAKTYLAQHGVAADRIHCERFAVQGTGRAPERTGTVHLVRFARRQTALKVRDHETILDAALAAGIALPSSCQMGGCGACRQHIISGEVELEEPNCLTDEERARGLRLLCIGRPRGNVVVDA